VSGGTRSVLEGLLQRPVKGYFNGPVKRTRTFIYGTPQRHKIPLKLIICIRIVSLKLTTLIQNISYYTGTNPDYTSSGMIIYRRYYFIPHRL
jgi:hypothetical protein